MPGGLSGREFSIEDKLGACDHGVLPPETSPARHEQNSAFNRRELVLPEETSNGCCRQRGIWWITSHSQEISTQKHTRSIAPRHDGSSTVASVYIHGPI